uniref:TRAF3-interacting protein 1 N-terminal domain-containing protein n=1 Tax=Vombatus ursinus TaxID=29139 RepID=A0A4X2KUK3_VOMUR
MNASVVKRTQEALGKVIKKPPLTEKLLSKPPFRYLHDIITEVRARGERGRRGAWAEPRLRCAGVSQPRCAFLYLRPFLRFNRCSVATEKT